MVPKHRQDSQRQVHFKKDKCNFSTYPLLSLSLYPEKVPDLLITRSFRQGTSNLEQVCLYFSVPALAAPGYC